MLSDISKILQWEEAWHCKLNSRSKPRTNESSVPSSLLWVQAHVIKQAVSFSIINWTQGTHSLKVHFCQTQWRWAGVYTLSGNTFSSASWHVPWEISWWKAKCTQTETLNNRGIWEQAAGSILTAAHDRTIALIRQATVLSSPSHVTFWP